MANKIEITEWFKELQDSICNALEEADGKATFHQDLWERPGGGGGRTRIIQEGNVIEKGGVNFSAVEGQLPSNIQQALGVEGDQFYATGVSIVIHPNSPMVPIIHMNTRYFEIGEDTWWFGGGIDLTPHYIDQQQAKWFHEQLKNVCDQFSSDYYPKHKDWADQYFFNKHRDETRGVGGIFFDRMNGDNKDQIFEYVREVGKAFAPIYTHFMHENRDLPFGENEEAWQMMRRGRYVEFNLVYDKGTKFGLDTSGRIESILMSLPKRAGWEYNHQPAEGSKEKETLDLLKKGIDWINI